MDVNDSTNMQARWVGFICLENTVDKIEISHIKTQPSTICTHFSEEVNMKIILALLSTVAAVAAFSPSGNVKRTSIVMNAEPTSRKAFLSAAALSAFGVTVIPAVAKAGTMAQEFVSDPTEQWETGSPTASAAAARKARFANSRTQITSNFAPIKRLTLERKSPVTRLDINAPDFTAYKRTFPGLYKSVPGKD